MRWRTMGYYVYIIRCEDDTLYTGITTDVARRMKEHFGQGKKCAKYTMVHKAKKVEAVWQTDTRASASRLEYFLKHLKKCEKEDVIKVRARLKRKYGYQDDMLKPLADVATESYLE